MTDENKELTPTLVMRRFFRALREENLMAAELLATHDNFDGGGQDYTRTLDKLVIDATISWPAVEWLLTFANGSHRAFFRPSGESRRRRRGGNNWRGHLCDTVRRWMQAPDKLDDQQRRIARLTYDIGWLQPNSELLGSETGRKWLQEIYAPDRLLQLALGERSTYIDGKYVRMPPCMPVIEWLIAKGPLDLDRCGNDLVRCYKAPEHRALVLRLVEHRDTRKVMPSQFTDMIQDVVLKYKLYQKLQQDLPTLLGAKTHAD